MRVLRLDSSARLASVSRQLTAKFVETWKAADPDTEVVDRNLAATPLPYITDDWMASYGDPAKMTAAQRQYFELSDSLVQELVNSDVIVIGAPMYNFSISWPLKAWIDQIVRIGKTVVYSPSGPKGLLTGKRAVVITSRGGEYSSDPSALNFDFQEAYLRRILGFIGVTDVTFVHTNHQRRSEQAAHAFAATIEQIEQTVTKLSSTSFGDPQAQTQA